MKRNSFSLLVCLAACGGGTKYMVRADTPGPTAAPAGKVMVVFIRASSYASSMTPTVLDGQGNYIGQVPARGYVRHLTTPGKHRFLVWAENTAPMHAEFAAGKTYYVYVGMRMGAWSARAHLLPVKAGSSDWDKVDEWVAESREWVATAKIRAQWKKDKGEGAAKQLERAEQMWRKYDEEDRAKRTVVPADGR